MEKRIESKQGEGKKYLSLPLKNTVAIFSKPFKGLEAEILEFLKSKNPKKIVFLDTPPMQGALTAIDQIREILPKVEIIWRDHHDIKSPSNERDAEIANIAGQIREKIGESAVIETRKDYPAISLLLNEGQYNSEDTVIIADNDLDGFTGALKASGITYPELDKDAEILDGPRSMQNENTLSEKAWLLTRAMSTLPPFNPSAPHISISAKEALYKEFIEMIEGSEEAKGKLETKVKEYEKRVNVSQELLKKVETLCEKVLVLDTRGSDPYDLNTIAQQLEKNAIISILIKSEGPIAKFHGGTQITATVSKKFQENFDIRKILPVGYVSSPETGIIANTPFMIHMSEKVWEEFSKEELKKISAELK